MGGGGGKKKKKARVQHAETLDYAALMREANQSAQESYRDQLAAQIEAYPQLEALQLGTVDKIASGLNNNYTQWAIGELQDASRGAGRMTNVGQTQEDLGNYMAQQARGQFDRSGPTSIESRLYADAERELALGRALSPEQQREAAQSARQAFSARGLGTSMGSAAAELLNRDRYATQREADRRNFAGSVNQMQTQNVLARRAQATNEMGMGGNLLANATNAYNAATGARLGVGSAAAALDPYARALGLGQPYSTSTAGNTGAMVGNTFNTAQQGALGVASFNANMIDSRANSQLNNWAAMNAARMQSSALGQQGMMGMIGGIGGGAVIGTGIAI